jgi:hypothetical protein
MQMKLTIAAVAALFVLASFPVLAVEMPTDGTKNFSPPGSTPSYFANETVPESARVANPATFTREDVAAIPEGTEVDPVDLPRMQTGRHGRHASAYRFGKHGFTGGKGAYKTGAFHGTAPHAGAGRANTTRHAKTNIRQHAAAVPATRPARISVG